MKPFNQWNIVTKWIVGILLLFFLFFTAIITYSTWKVFRTAQEIYQPVDRYPSTPRQQAAPPFANRSDADVAPSSQFQPPIKPEKKEFLTKTFLIVGIDRESESNDIGRTDVIMLAILKGQTGKLTLTSIPRDTYVDIAGKEYKDKINAAYQFGIETTIATVENFTEIVVDHYVLFNFDGFVKAIDSMGGIALEVDRNVSQELHISQGLHHLNGKQVLEFARFRSDARGDFGRNDRQQSVLKAVLEQSKGIRSPGKVKEILETVGKDVRTDLPFSEIVSLSSHLHDFSGDQVEQIKYKANTARFGPQYLSYVLINEQERKRVADLLKQSLLAK